MSPRGHETRAGDRQRRYFRGTPIATALNAGWLPAQGFERMARCRRPAHGQTTQRDRTLTIITLFHEAPSPRPAPSAAVLSLATHALVLGLSVFYIAHSLAPPERLEPSRYNVRLIHMTLPELRRERAHSEDAGERGATAASQGRSSRANTAASSASAMEAPPLLPVTTHPAVAKQTLVQPDLPPDLLAKQKIPIPQVVLWSPGQTTVKLMPPPPLLPINTPAAHPSLAAPVPAMQIADLRVAPQTFGTSRLTLPPSTTTPMVVHQPVPMPQMPSTTSLDAGMATPARVISLSETRLEAGTITLPPVQSIGSATGTTDGQKAPASGSVVSGLGWNGAGKGNGHAADAGTAEGAGHGAATGHGLSGDHSLSEGQGANAQNGNGTHGSTTAGHGAGGGGEGVRRGQGAGSGSNEPATEIAQGDGGTGDQAGRVTELRQPMNGDFSSVVIGSSIAERYPETMQLWAGRLAYTVYLHMGVPKNWILQYAVTREATRVGGDAAQPNAPWPYLMERPNLAAEDFSSDALMVHATINAAGRFESMSVLFPADFAQARFVLSALEQWRFRPARQNGKNVPVEVLLIIPEAD